MCIQLGGEGRVEVVCEGRLLGWTLRRKGVRTVRKVVKLS